LASPAAELEFSTEATFHDGDYPQNIASRFDE
jgi:hypothetical protein